MLKNKIEQIKIVFLPYVFISLLTLVGLVLFRWIFDLQLGILPLKEEMYEFWIPFFVPWIPILIWMRNRIRILDIGGKRENGYFVYEVILSLLLFVPIMNSMLYVSKASFDLNLVRTVEQQPPFFTKEKYFRITNYRIKKEESINYFTSRTSGKYNEHLDFDLFYACPFERGNSKIWYALKFQKRINNNLSDSEKNIAYETFMNLSKADFARYSETKFRVGVQYFEKLGHSDDRDGYIHAIQRVYPQQSEEGVAILIPHRKNFSERIDGRLKWISVFYIGGLLIAFLMIIIPKTHKNRFTKYKKGQKITGDDLPAFLSLLYPLGANKMIALLIFLNIFIFILMIFKGVNMMSPSTQELIEWGGQNQNLVIENGEYWRLLTHLFIHSGLGHLFGNIMTLLLVGMFLEPLLKPIKLLAIYLICGVLSAGISIWWGSEAVSIGASGAIFGLIGVLFIFNLFHVFPKLARGIIWAILITFISLTVGVGMVYGGIDNVAHLGGVMIGSLCGSLYLFFFRKELKNDSHIFI